LGLVTPLGSGVSHVWERLINGQSGLRGIQSFDVSDLPSKIAGQVPLGETSEGLFNANDFVEPKDQRKLDRFIVFGMAAAQQAIEDSGWQPERDEDRWRTGVMIGSGIGGLETIYDGSITVHDRGPRRLSPFFIPAALINLVSGQVSIKHGFQGPNHAVVTACSTGAHAIGDAARLIMLDDADVMVAGGAEAAVCRLGIAGFCASRALSTKFNDTPERGCRRGGARGTRACQGARCDHLRRGGGLRPERRRAPHHRAAGRRQRRLPRHAGGAEAGRTGSRRYRLHQRARHLDAPGRRDRGGGG
jgi:3-oxoacyl-[acyl-carrier-protein] synthase II